MPKMPVKKQVDETPENLRPYLFHGVDLTWKKGDKNAVGQCPFCSREGKFNVLIETGVWRCLTCNEKGNATVFIRQLHEASKGTVPEGLVEQRRLLNGYTISDWGICSSTITQETLVPGYGIDGKLNQLYRYAFINGRWLLLPTPTLGHQLHYVVPWKKQATQICLMEGPWDALALYEVMGRSKSLTKLVMTRDVSESLLKDVNIVAVPGCATFNESWCELFAGKIVNLMYDNDHAKRQCKRCNKSHSVSHKVCPTCKGQLEKTEIPPGGLEGMKRVAGILYAYKNPPQQINYLKWGNDGEGYDLSLSSGYDVRDAIAPTGSPLESRITLLDGLLDKIVEVPTEWLKREGVGAKNGQGKNDLKLLPCDSYKTLVNAWKKAMKWTEGLDYAFSAMLASIVSTMSVGDALWLKVMSPPSTGKTSLAQGLAACKQFVRATDTLRGFTSGYKLPDGSTKDLATELNGMTLITMDGDTLLQLPNLQNVLSEARRLYDGTLNSHFKNATGKDVSGHRMTWLLCGTASLRALDTSELGARFLDCVIMDKIDEDLEDEILERVANRAARHMAIESDGKAESHQDPDMTLAMQLAGGYVQHLRNNANDLISTVEVADKDKRTITRLGKFAAFMRARPSIMQDETAEREFAARLVSQHMRLAIGEAVVLNKTTVDEDVMNRVRKIALDTSRGPTLDIVKYLREHGKSPLRAISVETVRPEAITRDLLRFLRQIGVTTYREEIVKGVKQGGKWELTERMSNLFNEVMGDSDA